MPCVSQISTSKSCSTLSAPSFTQAWVQHSRSAAHPIPGLLPFSQCSHLCILQPSQRSSVFFMSVCNSTLPVHSSMICQHFTHEIWRGSAESTIHKGAAGCIQSAPKQAPTSAAEGLIPVLNPLHLWSPTSGTTSLLGKRSAT